MPKKTLNTTIEPDAPQSLPKIVDQVIFAPSSTQAKVKAKFWTKFQPGPLTNGDNITMSVALEVTKSAQLRKWWSEPGFSDWFGNKEEERERIKYLFNKGLDTIEDILDNPEANANAKANLIKMLAEMNGYLGKKPVEKFADESINKMSADQLRAFLEQKGIEFKQEKVIDVSSPTKDKSSQSEDEKRSTASAAAKED